MAFLGLWGSKKCDPATCKDQNCDNKTNHEPNLPKGAFAGVISEADLLCIEAGSASGVDKNDRNKKSIGQHTIDQLNNLDSISKETDLDAVSIPGSASELFGHPLNNLAGIRGRDGPLSRQINSSSNSIL